MLNLSKLTNWNLKKCILTSLQNVSIHVNKSHIISYHSYKCICCTVNGIDSIIMENPCAYFGTVPMPNFNKNLYQGQWFMHQMYDWTGSMKYDCYVQVHTPTADGNQNITEILIDPGLEPDFRSDGVMTFNVPGYGHYIYTSADHPTWLTHYEILATDYFNYAIVWNCTDAGSGSRGQLYIYSREPVVNALTQSQIDSTLNKYHISKTGLRTLNITSCPEELLEVPGGPGLLERVLQIVAGLVGTVVGAVGGLVGGLGGLLG